MSAPGRQLLVLAPLPESSASTRFRLTQFFPALEQAGIEPVLRPFLDQRGFEVLYRAGALGTKARAAAAALAGRLSDLVRASRADAVLIHREAALVGPPLLEWIIARGIGKPVIFDLDDAIWVPYASPTYGARLSRLLKAPQKTDFSIAAASLVIAGNEYIAAHARHSSAHVEVVPTVVDTAVFRPAPRPPSDVPVIGWIGTHSTAAYLATILPALRKVAQRRSFRLRVVGGHVDGTGLPIEEVPWSLGRELADYQNLDIGLYPLVNDAWALGKSGFKAVQYMACGVPVVATPVGVTAGMIVDGENGFLVNREDEWVDRIERLLDDADLRRQMGEAGRRHVLQRWSLQVHGPRFVSLVQQVMARNRSLRGAGSMP